MPALIHQRCFNHGQREAAGRCVGCGHFFCRECLVEHDARLVCAACLRTPAAALPSRRPLLLLLLQAAQVLGGVLLLWMMFYLLGRVLLALPSSFHEGTLWRDAWMDTP